MGRRELRHQPHDGSFVQDGASSGEGVPCGADLRRTPAHLEEAFELADEGAEYVVSGDYREAALGENGWKSLNLRTQLLKLIRRAGLQPWPKLWQNLRASCETDLMRDHPIHAVTSWIGNTPTVALKHYIQVLDSDFDKAVRGGAESGAVLVQNPVQSPTATGRQEVIEKPETVLNAGDGHSVTVPVSYCHSN